MFTLASIENMKELRFFQFFHCLRTVMKILLLVEKWKTFSLDVLCFSSFFKPF